MCKINPWSRDLTKTSGAVAGTLLTLSVAMVALSVISLTHGNQFVTQKGAYAALGVNGAIALLTTAWLIKSCKRKKPAPPELPPSTTAPPLGVSTRAGRGGQRDESTLTLSGEGSAAQRPAVRPPPPHLDPIDDDGPLSVANPPSPRGIVGSEIFANDVADAPPPPQLFVDCEGWLRENDLFEEGPHFQEQLVQNILRGEERIRIPGTFPPRFYDGAIESPEEAEEIMVYFGVEDEQITADLKAWKDLKQFAEAGVLSQEDVQVLIREADEEHTYFINQIRNTITQIEGIPLGHECSNDVFTDLGIEVPSVATLEDVREIPPLHTSWLMAQRLVNDAELVARILQLEVIAHCLQSAQDQGLLERYPLVFDKIKVEIVSAVTEDYFSDYSFTYPLSDEDEALLGRIDLAMNVINIVSETELVRPEVEMNTDDDEAAARALQAQMEAERPVYALPDDVLAAILAADFNPYA